VFPPAKARKTTPIGLHELVDGCDRRLGRAKIWLSGREGGTLGDHAGVDNANTRIGNLAHCLICKS
jgi:hypothetical protein